MARRRSNPKWWLLLLLAAVAVLVLMARTTRAQEAGPAVSGQVVNGTEGSAVPGNLVMLLETYSADQFLGARTVMADEQGRFTFADVPSGATVYYVGTVHLGVPYSTPVEADADLSDVTVTIYETTETLDLVSFVSSSLLVIGADPETRRVSFFELVQVRNSGDRTFVPNQGGVMGFLRFPLPEGAEDLEVQADLPSGEAILVDRGVGLTAPVPPGEYSVAFGYALPYKGDSSEFSRTFLEGMGRFRVLVPQGVAQVTGDGSMTSTTTAVEGLAFWLLEAVDVPLGGALRFTLRSLPQPTLWQRVTSAAGGDVAVLAAPGLLVVGLGLLLLLGALRRAAPGAEAPALVPSDRGGLLRAVAALDDACEAGELSEEVYDRQRGILMIRLLLLERQGLPIPLSPPSLKGRGKGEELP
ncbi:MAG: hypothetical protein HY532_07770 [Chloroflexi bacterium]|nr:hypothetical protein [Chloroflexota bacterium]